MAVDKITKQAKIARIGDQFTTDYGQRQKVTLEVEGKTQDFLYCGDMALDWREHKGKSMEFVMWKAKSGWCCDLAQKPQQDPFTKGQKPSGGKDDVDWDAKDQRSANQTALNCAVQLLDVLSRDTEGATDVGIDSALELAEQFTRWIYTFNHKSQEQAQKSLAQVAGPTREDIPF